MDNAESYVLSEDRIPLHPWNKFTFKDIEITDEYYEPTYVGYPCYESPPPTPIPSTPTPEPVTPTGCTDCECCEAFCCPPEIFNLPLNA